jgi:hypothetical protein
MFCEEDSGYGCPPLENFYIWNGMGTLFQEHLLHKIAKANKLLALRISHANYLHRTNQRSKL